MRAKYTDIFDVEVLSAGPEVEVMGKKLGPDEVIALEGIGTFESVSVKERARDLLEKGKDLRKYAFKVHRESTRRGHASLTTSFTVFYEVRDCSRLLSLLLVSPPFGSHLQESQRRVEVERSRLLIPAELRGTQLEDRYDRVMDEVHKAYRLLVDGGIDKEDARYLLPLSSATSLFSSVSFEAYFYLIKNSSREGFFPLEVRVWSEKFLSALREKAPLLLDARLSFEGPWNYFPLSNPVRPPDGLMNYFSLSKDEEARVLTIDVPDVLRPAIENSIKDVMDAYSNIVKVTTLENLSLVAYHQATRHRTVQTSAESVHDAASRALKGFEGQLVVPPSLKGKEKLLDVYLSSCSSLLELYKLLLDEGYQAASAYALPQALKLRVVRSYNLFNLVYPMGFIATRTCSHAQWEERAIAYKIWRDVGVKKPWLGSAMGEKCKQLGYCPEREWCPIILKYHHYSDELHRARNEF